MVVGWNRLSPCPELEGEDVVPASVSMSVGGIEVIDWPREDVDVLLHSLIGFGVVLVGDFHFQEIPSLVSWVEEPVVVEVLGGDIDLVVDGCAELVGHVVDGNHQWVQGVGAVDSDVVDFASNGQTGSVAVGVEVVGEGECQEVAL